MRRTALPIAVILLAVLAAAVALGQVGAGPGGGAQAAVISSAGAIEISNDRDGLPVFAAAGIGPGDSVRGTVGIAATGSEPVELTLSRHDLLDTPGLGGGLLSQALTLTVADVTVPAAPLAVYDGPLAAMPAQPAGRLAPGASRTYAFVATLSAAGADDAGGTGGAGGAAGAGDQNALQGASVSVAYSWTATEAEPGDPGPGDESETPGGGAPGGNPPGGGAPGGQVPDKSVPPGDASSSPTSVPILGGHFQLRVTRAAKALRGGRLFVWARCERACAIVVGGRLRATAAGRHRGARLRCGQPVRYRPGVQRLRIRVPGKLRRWLATTPGKRRLRATLTLTATDPLGARDTVKRTLKLKPPRRR